MSLSEIRDYLSRHFLGRVKVHRRVAALPAPAVLPLRREVATHAVRTHARVLSAELLPIGGLNCSSRDFRFSSELVRVKGSRITRYAPRALRIGTARPLRASVRAELKRAQVLPQERRNRLQWQKARPAEPGVMVLAWYGPIVEGAVAKLTLNKQRGTLLIWYNPQSRHFNPRGLYLCRRLGVREKPEWRWV